MEEGEEKAIGAPPPLPPPLLPISSPFSSPPQGQHVAQGWPYIQAGSSQSSLMRDREHKLLEGNGDRSGHKPCALSYPPPPPPPPSGHDMWYTYTVPILYSVLLGEESRGSNRPQTSPVTLSTLTALLVVFVRRNRTWYCPSLCKHEPFKNTNWLRLEVSVNIKKFDLTYGKKNYVRFGSAFFLHGSGSNLNYKYGSGSGSNLFLDPA